MNFEQRANLKFLVKLEKTPTEALAMLQQVYGEDAMGRTQLFEWHKKFKEGREDLADDPRSGRPSTSRHEDNIQHVKQLVRSDRRLTVRMIAEELAINKSTVWSIISEDLGMRKVCAKMVPKLLSNDQKDQRLVVCEDILQNLEEDPEMLKRVITGDESWIFQYDPETKRQSLQWKCPGSPRPKKAKMSKSQIKVMLVVFFDVRGIVHMEFLPQGTTVNQHVYKEILQRLLRSIRDKRRDLWDQNSWLLHHDNAPAHTAISIRAFLAKKNIVNLDHPPYSPDLAPCDFFLFPKLKGVIKGTRFDDLDAIKRTTTKELRSIPQVAFQGAIESWKKRMEKCARLQGDYFEGENLQ